MTTIAYRDGVLAADSLAVRNGTVTGHVVKVHQLADGRLVGLLGDAGGAHKLMEWLKAGEAHPQPDCDDAAIVVILGDGACIIYESGVREPASVAPFKAWGSGGEIAIGAMGAGATVQRAVEIACEYDTHTGGKVETLTIKEAPNV